MFLLALALGCSSTTVIPLGDEKLFSYRTSPEKIRVFAEKPDTTFVQIALMDYSGSEWWWSSKASAIKAVKEKASQLGGDGIILQSIGTETTGGSVNPQTGWITTYDKPVAKAIIIRFTP